MDKHDAGITPYIWLFYFIVLVTFIAIIGLVAWAVARMLGGY